MSGGILDSGPWRDSFTVPTDTVVPASPGVSADVALLALEQAGHAVCITDAELDEPGPRLQYVNQAYLDMFCCDENEVLGRTPRIGQGPLTSRSVLDRIREHLEAGTSLRAQAINYRVDGTPFRLRWTIDPVFHDGEIVKFVAVMSDVTHEDRLRRRFDALDRLTSLARPAAHQRGAERHRTIASALAEALEPMLSELGEAVVTIGGSRSMAGGGSAEPNDLDMTDAVRHRIEIRGDDRIDLSVHPDAHSLLDSMGIEELATHTRWLVDLPEPR